ncbi:MAG: hypothetical protein ACLGIN_12115, partial [Candidatus Sericytochromatia bacterium]
MQRPFRLTAAALAAAWLLAGCGVAGPQAMVTRDGAPRAASADASLIGSYRAIAGYDEGAIAERLRLIEAMGQSGGEAAAELLFAEYGQLGRVPVSAAARLEGPLLDAMAAIASSTPTEMRANKRFSFWKELDKLLGRKK